MRLIFNCISCKKKNIYTPNFSNRGDLQMQMGDDVKVNCSHCGQNSKKNVNEISAEEDKRVLIGGVVVSLISTIVFWFYFGALSTLSFVIIFLVWAQEHKLTSNFNRYKIRNR